MRVKQIVFKHFGEDNHNLGILIDNKQVICACCGAVFNKNEVEIVRKYEFWNDLMPNAFTQEIR